MNWFEEQSKQRIDSDDMDFANAYAAMAASLIGEKAFENLTDDKLRTQNAIA